jgi:hypothetical protein
VSWASAFEHQVAAQDAESSATPNGRNTEAERKKKNVLIMETTVSTSLYNAPVELYLYTVVSFTRTIMSHNALLPTTVPQAYPPSCGCFWSESLAASVEGRLPLDGPTNSRTHRSCRGCSRPRRSRKKLKATKNLRNNVLFQIG